MSLVLNGDGTITHSGLDIEASGGADINRTGEGDMLSLKTGGTTRFKISVASTDNVIIGATSGGGGGFQMWGGGGTDPIIGPADASTGTGTTGLVSFGRASERFKQAFFSDTVHIGDTDYEYDGIATADPFQFATTNGSHVGYRTNLGFFGASGTSWIHIKTNIGGSTNKMVKFEYDGYTYSTLNVHNSVTFYTYAGSASPHSPSLVNWGETTGGIVNYYYSSDDYVVIVIQTSSSYTGGFLYYQSGRSHYQADVDVLAYTNSASTSGAY